VRYVRVYFVWFLWLSCFSGAAREYYGGLSYDGHMDDITGIEVCEMFDYLKKIVCGLYSYLCMVYLMMLSTGMYRGC
jgi:hypothetical protein